MAEKPILFTGWSMQRILADAKTQTRRIAKNGFMYSLTDDYIHGVYTENHSMKGQSYETSPCLKADSNLSEQRLSRWIRWANLLTNEMERLWQSGVRGLVSASPISSQQSETIRNTKPQEQEDDSFSSQAHLHGLSRDACKAIISGATFGWRPHKQSSIQSEMGNAGRKLARQESTRTRKRRREASYGQTHERRMFSFEMGAIPWSVQSVSRGASLKNVAGWHISYHAIQIGTLLWCRETWAVREWYTLPCSLENGYRATIETKADGHTHHGIMDVEWTFEHDNTIPVAHPTRWLPSIFMPKWATREWLEVVEVQREHIQEISEEDAIAEGCEVPHCPDCGYTYFDCCFHMDHRLCQQPDPASGIPVFASLWDSINGKKPGWSWADNPMICAYTFKRIDHPTQ